MASPAQNALSFLQSGIQQGKEKLEEYFKPTPEVRARDVLREVGKLVSGVLKPPESPEEARKLGFIPTSLTPEGKVKTAVGVEVGAIKTVGKKVLQESGKIIGNYLKSKVSLEPTESLTTKFKDKVYNTFHKFYSSVVDRFNPIVNISKTAAKEGKILPGQSPELLSRRYLGVRGIAESKLFWNVSDITPEGNLKITGESLSKVLQPVKNNLDDLRALMIAERDIELSKRVLPSGKKIIGTTPEQSQQLLNVLSQKWGKNFNTLQDTATAVRKFTRDAVLTPLKELGVLSPQNYNKIVSSNEFYAPFQRVMDDLESTGFVGSRKNVFTPKEIPIKKIKGSERQIIDPLESIIKDVYRTTDFIERIRVAKSIVNLRNISPEVAKVITPVRPKIIPVAQEKGKPIFRPSLFNPADNTIMVFEEGKRKFYQVEKELFNAMSGMSSGDSAMLFKILGFPAKTLRAGATLTPEFIGRNPIRDQWSAFVFSRFGYRPGIDFIAGIWNVIGRKDLFQKWLASGGSHSMFVSLDRASTQRTLQEVVGKKLKATLNPLEALRALSEFGEKGTRLGAFRRALKSGATDLEAMFESREVTLDFSRMGTYTKSVNQIIAFFNARLQGLDRIVRAFQERPISTTAKVISGITLPSIALYLAQKDNPRYQEVPRWQKDLFWVIVLPDNGPIIRIPKPFELGIVFGSGAERIVEWIDKNDPDALRGFLTTVQKGSIGFPESFIPTAMLPWIENATNYSFFRDRPIVSQSIQDLPPELQANTYTSETAKLIGKLIKKSPEKIENLINGYFAGLGNYALDTTNFILKRAGIVDTPVFPTPTLADIPLLRAFITREPVGNNSESVARFFEEYERAIQWEQAAKDAANRGDIEGSTKIMEQHPEMLLASGMRRVVKDLSQIRQQKEFVFLDKTLKPDEKKELLFELDTMMTEITKQALLLITESEL